jgi:hypothetical protein
MPTELKVVILLNVVSVVAIGIVTLCAFAGGGFVSGVFPEHEVHEMVLVPVSPEEARRLRRVPDLKTVDVAASRAEFAPRQFADGVDKADVLPQYRTNDPTPSPWVSLPDGSVRMLRND